MLGVGRRWTRPLWSRPFARGASPGRRSTCLSGAASGRFAAMDCREPADYAAYRGPHREALAAALRAVLRQSSPLPDAAGLAVCGRQAEGVLSARLRATVFWAPLTVADLL